MKTLTSLLALSLIAVTTASSCDEAITAPDTCVTGRTMAIGVKVDGEVTKGDCKIEEHFVDSYALTLTEQTTIRFNVTSATGVDVRVTDPSRPEPVREIMMVSGGQAYQHFVVLPAGSYVVDVGSDENTGTYSVQTTAVTPPEPGGCVMNPTQQMYVAPIITVAGVLTSADCTGAQAAYKSDAYTIRLVAGQLRKFTVTASAAATIEVHDFVSGATVTFKPMNAAGTNVLQYAPTATGYYVVNIIGSPGTGSITYTFKAE